MDDLTKDQKARAAILAPQLLKNPSRYIKPMFTAYPYVGSSDSGYSERLYTTGIRSWLYKKNILGVDTFEPKRSAKGYLDFPAYLKHCEATYSDEEWATALSRLVVATANEEDLLYADTRVEHVERCMRYFQKAFFWEMWLGMERERLAFKALKEALPEGFRVGRMKEKNDMTYMTDLVVVGPDGNVAAGLSVKGPYYSSGKKTKGSYVQQNDAKEVAGTTRFRSHYGAPVLLMVSDVADIAITKRNARGIVQTIMGKPQQKAA